MKCTPMQDLVEAYIDGELDLAASLEVEKHLQECDRCSQVQQRRLALRQAFRSANLYHNAPPILQEKILSKMGHSPRMHWWLGMAAAAAIVLTAWQMLPRITPSQQLAQEIVAGHVRSLQAEHLIDVASSDQHTVKPWFAGKLDFTPPTPNFKDEGFTLLGGRLDYVGEHAVAALVYQHQKHFINVFVWPVDSAQPGLGETTLRGYHVIRWNQDGMAWSAVSDAGMSELEQLEELIQHGPTTLPQNH